MVVFHSVFCICSAAVFRVKFAAIIKRLQWHGALVALPLLMACQRGAVPTLATAPAMETAPVTIPPASFNPRVQGLLAQMTREEKIGQMTQPNISVINTTEIQKDIVLDSTKAAALVRNFHIGSFMNGEAVPATQWVRYPAALQRITLRESRLHVPVVYGIDHTHGASCIAGTTIFPHNINLGASFNPEPTRLAARATVLESANLGHHWIFAPVLDLGVNVCWSRFYETYGEDPLVAATLGAACMREIQTNTEIASYRKAACGKHFLGYSDLRNGWDRTNTLIPDQRLQEFFRPSFQAAIDAELKSIMINPGEVNGEPVHASFEKQAFAAGQTRNLTFDLNPLRDLSYPDGQGRPQLENGWYTLRVGVANGPVSLRGWG